MALERLAAQVEACLAKVAHCETRLMHMHMRGFEFVRLWDTAVSGWTEHDLAWFVRQTGDLMGSFMDSRQHLSLDNKYHLVRFYLSVAIVRMRVGAEATQKLSKVQRLSDWEHMAWSHAGKWPWGQEIFTEQVMKMTKQKLRDWQGELMQQNETVEVVHISDGWELELEQTAVRTEPLQVQDGGETGGDSETPSS